MSTDNDIIERLRKGNHRSCLVLGEPCKLCRERIEAAAEIERLRKALASFRSHVSNQRDQIVHLRSENERLRHIAQRHIDGKGGMS